MKEYELKLTNDDLINLQFYLQMAKLYTFENYRNDIIDLKTKNKSLNEIEILRNKIINNPVEINLQK